MTQCLVCGSDGHKFMPQSLPFVQRGEAALSYCLVILAELNGDGYLALGILF